jgi:AcrR family transcriptional regulator
VATRSRTRLSPEQRRGEILAVAAVAFREQPYSAVSLESVADRAGVTRGLLHHYFGSKRGLYEAVVTAAVRVPDSVRIVPPGVSGSLEEVLDACVESWMRMIEAAGQMWWDAIGSGDLASGEAGDLVIEARDHLVDRMVDEVPWPSDVDPESLRVPLRCYSAFTRAATHEWLIKGSVSRAQAKAMLHRTLVALVRDVVPAMDDA